MSKAIALRFSALLIAASWADAAEAITFTSVPIPGTNNIQTSLMNTFPTGTFIANNALATPFNISTAPGKCGPSGAAPCNFYDGFGSSGRGRSIRLNVSVASPTDVYTLMNAYSPANGEQLATITFLGTGGASLTFPLIAGQDIRDYYVDGFANSLNNGVAGVEAVNAFTCTAPTTCQDRSQAGTPGTYLIDEQHFSLGTVFAGQTLTQIVLTDTYNGSTPILLGVTVGTPLPPTQPTPVRSGYSVSLVVSGLSGPDGIVYRPAAHDLLVCELHANRVSSVNVLTGLVSPFTSVATPEHIAVDSTGNVYVTTANSGGPITTFNSIGQTVSSFLVAGYPVGLALDANDNLYLANNATKVIAKYPHGSFTNPTTFASGFQSLQGITFDTNGRLFAEDYVAGIVYYVTPEGNTVWASGLGSLNEALLQIAYDQFSGSLLVAGYTGVVSEIPFMGVANTFATGFSVPAGIAVDTNQNTYVADFGSGNVWKFTPVPQPLSITAVSNAASFQSGPVSPGEIVTISGTNIGPTNPAYLMLDENSNVSTSIGGVQVLFNDIPAPLTYASNSQINAVVPYQIAGLLHPSVQISFLGQTSNVFPLQSAATVPGLFTLNSSGTGPGAILNQDDSPNSPVNPAARGSYVAMFLTGEGQTAPPGVTGKITTLSPTAPLTPQPLLPVTVTIGGQPASIAFYGEAPGLVSGILQVNVQIPTTVPSGNLSIQVSVGGNTSQDGATVSVR